MDNIIMVINIYLPLDKESWATVQYTGHWTLDSNQVQPERKDQHVPGAWWLLVAAGALVQGSTLRYPQHHTSHTVQRTPVITCTLPSSPDITGSRATTAMVFSAISIAY